MWFMPSSGVSLGGIYGQGEHVLKPIKYTLADFLSVITFPKTFDSVGFLEDCLP